MTRVYIGRDHLRITGHSGYGPEGQDIVCAAVSTLSQSLGQALLDMGVKTDRIKFSPGEAEIRFQPDEKTDGAMAVIRAGFRFLAAAYPSYVCITKEGDF